MKSQVLIRRYVQGLVRSLKDEQEYATLSAELAEFRTLLETQPQVENILKSRFLPSRKKMEILEDILRNAEFLGKTTRFVLLLVENDRLKLLDGILDFLPELWNESRGITTFEVSSVLPLTEDQKGGLKETLEKLEKREVFLKYREDPSLVGGLSIRKKNIIYDVSLRGELARLQETLSEG